MLPQLSYATDGTLRLKALEYEDDAGVWQPITNATVTCDEIVNIAGQQVLTNITMAWVAGLSAYRGAIPYNSPLPVGTYKAIVTADGGAGKRWHGELEFEVVIDS